jgi:ferredoxin
VIRIEFRTTDGNIVAKAESEPFEALIDVCDACHAPVEFSCRGGSCGTCRVEVIAGQDLLQPPREDELETLDAFDAPASHRLACRARLAGAEGLVRLRWAGDDP